MRGGGGGSSGGAADEDASPRAVAARQNQVKPQAIGRSCGDVELYGAEVPASPSRSRNGANSPAPPSIERSPVATVPPLANLSMKGRGTKPSTSRRCLLHTLFTVRFLVKLLGVGLMIMVLVVAVVDWPPWAIEKEDVRSRVMTTLFVSGLFLVAVEDFAGINKSAVMLLLAATMWTFLAVGFHPNESTRGAARLHDELDRGLKDVGSVILFLLPAMGVVESIDHFDGFAVVTALIRRGTLGHSERLMPIICVLCFFLSSVIDNLTATIVSLKILRHIAGDDHDLRRECGGVVVVAANAGGTWSPIGDVTTTMLWIQGKISPGPTVVWLLFPSVVAGLLPLGGIYWQTRRGHRMRHSAVGDGRRLPRGSPRWPSQDQEGSRGADSSGASGDSMNRSRCASGEDGSAQASRDNENVPLAHGSFDEEDEASVVTRSKVTVLVLGVVSILLVPLLKIVTGLPPYLGMLLALGLVWIITDMGDFSPKRLEEEEDEEEPFTPAVSPPHSGVVEALRKVDLTGLLFFAGVLLAVGALDSAGVLRRYAILLAEKTGHSQLALCALLGVSSAIVDNVPLVEATIDMYKETPCDDPLWQLTALAAGTGGSILSIGSVAGVTLMSLENVSFLWYVRRVSLWAFIGFAAGIGTYQLERELLLP